MRKCPVQKKILAITSCLAYRSSGVVGDALIIPAKDQTSAQLLYAPSLIAASLVQKWFLHWLKSVAFSALWDTLLWRWVQKERQ